MESNVEKTSKRPSGNIILIGMMGAGKTTIGKLLAKSTGKTFLDSDEEIQRRTGVTIPHIFDVEGEAGFRKRESSVICDLLMQDNIVLATGGGAVLLEENRRALAGNGVVVYLKGSVNDLWNRTKHDRNRPLLQTEDPLGRMKELYEQRDPIYTELADLIVPSGKQSAQHLTAFLQRKLAELSKENESECKH